MGGDVAKKNTLQFISVCAIVNLCVQVIRKAVIIKF